VGSEDGVGGGAEAELSGGQGQDELGVFGGGADGNADGFGETHPAHGADDNAFVKEFVAEGFAVGTNGDKEEIGFARDGSEAEVAKFFKEAVTFGAVGFDGTADVVVVVQSGKGSGLADASDIERSPELVHFGDECGMADAVADAKTGEPVNLGKCAESEDVVVFAEEFAGVGKVGAGSVFSVGFIENDEDITRDFFEEGGKFGGAKSGASGVVGISDVDDAGLRGDRDSDGVEIKGVIAHGCLDEMAAASTDGDGK